MKTVNMNRELNRKIVEEGLRKRADARREAEQEARQEARTVELLEIVNGNSFVAEHYARYIAEENVRKARRAAKRAKLAKLRRKGARALSCLWATVGMTAAVCALYAFQLLPISAAVIAVGCCCISIAVCICYLWKNAGEIAEVMN